MIAAQIYAAIVDGTTAYPFTSWRVLAKLAAATTGAARDELLAATISIADELVPCMAEIAPLLDPVTVRAWARAELPAADRASQGLLLSMLDDEDLQPLLEQTLEIPEWRARSDAMWELVGSLSVERRRRASAWFQAASKQRYGLEIDAAYARSEAERTDEEVRAIIEVERARWGAPFTAWRLGDRALDLESPEREAMLERAIDAFEELVSTPVDPGNDEGPFWKIASALDGRQVHRALAILDRMDATKWCYRLAGSRSQLAIRLAKLGHDAEALQQLEHMMTTDAFAAHWRAETVGGIAGVRLARDPTASVELPPGDSEWRLRVLSGVVDQLRDQPPPSRHRVEACIAYAHEITDERIRRLALEWLTCWITALPVERWVELAVDPLTLAEAIVDAGGDPSPVLPLVPRDAEHFDELSRYRDYLGPELAAWTAWLRTGTKLELAPVLIWLGGPDAPLAVGRAIVRAINFRRSTS